MHFALRPAAAALCLAGILVPHSALAQGENAVPMRPGSFRLTLGGVWEHYTDRFGTANPFRPSLADGTLEPISIDMSSESLGVRQLPFLNSVQDSVRSLTGLSAFALDLGRHQVTLSASVRATPIRLTWAPSSRFGFGVSLPLVRARMSTFVLGPDTTNDSLGALTRGNVGFNSEFLSPGAMDQFRLQVDAALAALQQVATGGPAGLRAQAQAEYNALRPLACGLSTLATGAGSDQSSPCFSAGAPAPSTLLPVSTSAAGDSITTRLGRAKASYATTRSQFAAQGVTIPAFTEPYQLPTAPLDSNELRRFFSDPNTPLAADSLTEVTRTGIGDMEIGGWFQVANSARLRSQLQVLVRLPTGNVDLASSFQDIGTGDHQTDVEVALRNDVVVNQHFWMHVGGLYGVQMADQLPRRVSPWYLPFAPALSTAQVKRDLGDYFALDLVPNWQLDNAIGVGIGWHYFHQGETTFSYADPADQARIGLAADVLGEATAVSRMRVGAGVTFSTLDRYAAGRARLPYRVTWSYNTTMWGRGGQVPKSGIVMLEIQAYFGNLR